MDNNGADLIKTLEEKLMNTEIRKSPEILSELISDDFTEFGSSGIIYNKHDVIKALQNEVPSRIIIKDFNVTQLPPDTYVTTYKTLKINPEGMEILTERSSFWKLFNGKWQIVFHQGELINS